ncbi:hypothetical protein SCHPADRAFT_387797 [Schizopora paradoxa]|uniref:Uncharacterized protein n=1 Tax=Schizopora paradoxa TaxID=27342 RepID=A0A0H2S814_9AGAM|nr:hypothetical protein SCHPADRAFT_387797 [Schizopora paradoxa]
MPNSHYDVKFYVLTPTQSSASGTNAIGENLPGPGRNLGRLYDWLGQKFENILGKILFRAGYGPTNISRKIKIIRNPKWEEMESLAAELRDSDLRKLCRHCRKLVRYSRSGVLETQLRAVDAIIEFAIYDPLLNSILNYYVDSDSNEVLAWDISYSSSDPLLSSCRKALVSLSPSTIALHDAARQYGVRARTARMTVSFLRELFFPTMMGYLRCVYYLSSCCIDINHAQ